MGSHSLYALLTVVFCASLFTMCAFHLGPTTPLPAPVVPSQREAVVVVEEAAVTEATPVSQWKREPRRFDGSAEASDWVQYEEKDPVPAGVRSSLTEAEMGKLASRLRGVYPEVASGAFFERNYRDRDRQVKIGHAMHTIKQEHGGGQLTRALSGLQSAAYAVARVVETGGWQSTEPQRRHLDQSVAKAEGELYGFISQALDDGRMPARADTSNHTHYLPEGVRWDEAVAGLYVHLFNHRLPHRHEVRQLRPTWSLLAASPATTDRGGVAANTIMRPAWSMMAGARVEEAVAVRLEEPAMEVGSALSDCVLEEKLETLQVIASPIVLDLDDNLRPGTLATHRADDGVMTRDSAVAFDFDGDGAVETCEWFGGAGDGLLCEDLNGNGTIDSGRELFGTAWGHRDGYEQLAQRDVDGDGTVSGRELDGLCVWLDDGDGQCVTGELIDAVALGIESLDCTHEDFVSTFVCDGVACTSWDWWFDRSVPR